MRFTAQEEYGLRCMVQLARHHDKGMTIPELAQREALSTAYVGKLMRVLRRGGLVTSTRGQAGGYRLSQPPETMSIGTIIHTLDGSLWSDEFCDRYRGGEASCVHSTDCAIRALWSALDDLIEGLLGQCMLADLLCTECALEDWVQVAARLSS